ncbi:MAG: hypothetical protein ABUT39_26550 [Acidobacteriota bacterium]
MRTRLTRWSWSLLLAVLLLPGALWGQDAGPAATPAPTPTTTPASVPSTAAALPAPAPPAPAPAGPPVVRSVRSTNSRHPDRAGLGDAVILQVDHLDQYLDMNQNTCGGLILFLEDVPIPGTEPEACDPYTGEVRFDLDRTADSDRAWHALLAEPVSFTKKISVSVGAKGQLAFPTDVNEYELEIVPAAEFVTFLIGLVLSALLALYLAKNTPILRDRFSGMPAIQAPYSLARFQLAFWSFLVIAAYVFIWMLTEELDTITGSVLALLGIGSATALGASIIDQGKTEGTGVSNPAPAAAPADPVVPAAPRPSRGFLQDVLSDEQGISLYRFQLFAWTLVLGVIFCASVYNGLQMPQFSTTLLGLMGISSGTYLGFKVPENSSHG